MKEKDDIKDEEDIMKETSIDSSHKEERFYIRIEFSPDEYKKLVEDSSAQNKELDAYVRDSALKARNRKSRNSNKMSTSTAKRKQIKSKIKTISTSMVKLQQTENELYKVVKKRTDNEKELELLEDLQERMEEIWDS